MKVPGWIITAAISILTAVALELNKNTLLGWLLFVIALAGMAVISRNIRLDVRSDFLLRSTETAPIEIR